MGSNMTTGGENTVKNSANGYRLKMLREMYIPRMTQAELSRKTGIGIKTISRYESGATKAMQPSNRKLIARALKVKEDAF